MAKLKKLLIVDDDMFKHYERMKALLLSMGVDMQMCKDMETALVVIKDNKFDMMIFDVTLPNQKTGLNLLEEVRKNDKKTPVYILTAHGNVFESKSLSMGATGFFSKPFDFEEHVLKPLGLK